MAEDDSEAEVTGVGRAWCGGSVGEEDEAVDDDSDDKEDEAPAAGTWAVGAGWRRVL